MKTKSLFSRSIALISRHPMVVTCCVAICMAGAGAYLYQEAPIYESTAVISYPNAKQDVDFSIFQTKTTAAVEEITSPGFVAQAIKNKVDNISYFVDQDFKKRYSAYSFPYTITYKVTGKNFTEQSYDIRPTDDSNYILTSNILGIERTKTGKFDEELIDRELAITISKKKTTPYLAESLVQPAVFSFKIQSNETLADSLTDQTESITASEQNGVITINCRHESSDKAKQLADALATHFLTTRNGNVTPVEEGTTAIDEQLAQLSQQMEATETHIAEYKKLNNITEINFDTEKSLSILKELQLQKTQLELSRDALNNTSKYLRKNRDGNNSTVEYGAISDPVFSEQLSLLNSKYEAKSNGTASANIDTEIEALKTLIAERILNTRKKTAVQLHKINQDISAINTQLATLPEKATALNALDRKLALDRKVYELLVEKRAQAMVTGTGTSANGRILKPATTPVAPVAPVSWMILALGLLSGLIISIPLSYISQIISHRKIKSRQELDAQTRIPFLGSVTGLMNTTKGVNSSISDLCTKVLMRPEVKFITFASTNKGEGKTFITTHFAQAFAAMDKKVLVIDMNHENPGVADHFSITPERSLSDVLQGSCDIHDAISLTSHPNLDVLECGELSAGVNSLLASNKRITILEDLKKHYDIIVTDTPDLGTKIDAIPMMKMSDMSLFVVRANTTRKQSLVAAEQAKKDYELQNLFFLLNTVGRGNAQDNNSTRRSRVRKLNKQPEENAPSYIPSVLRKIALWFY